MLCCLKASFGAQTCRSFSGCLRQQLSALLLLAGCPCAINICDAAWRLCSIRIDLAVILQDLGLQDIARIDGWVKVDRPEPPLPEFEIEGPKSDAAESESAESDTAESDSADSDTEELPGSEQPTTDSSGMVTYDHSSAAEQLPEVVEELPDDVLEYNSSPISQRAVPILPMDLQEQDDDEYETLGSEYVQAESRLVDAESPEADSVSGSDDVDSISTDIEEEEEGSLLMEDASPQELCMYVTPMYMHNCMHVHNPKS